MGGGINPAPLAADVGDSRSRVLQTGFHMGSVIFEERPSTESIWQGFEVLFKLNSDAAYKLTKSQPSNQL